jgi:hypothetical protein
VEVLGGRRLHLVRGLSHPLGVVLDSTLDRTDFPDRRLGTHLLELRHVPVERRSQFMSAVAQTAPIAISNRSRFTQRDRDSDRPSVPIRRVTPPARPRNSRNSRGPVQTARLHARSQGSSREIPGPITRDPRARHARSQGPSRDQPTLVTRATRPHPTGDDAWLLSIRRPFTRVTSTRLDASLRWSLERWCVFEPDTTILQANDGEPSREIPRSVLRATSRHLSPDKDPSLSRSMLVTTWSRPHRLMADQ